MAVMAKILIATIQMNLVSNPSGMWRRQHKFAWIVILIYAISLPSQPFLSLQLEFHIFFSMAFLGAAQFLLVLD